MGRIFDKTICTSSHKIKAHIESFESVNSLASTNRSRKMTSDSFHDMEHEKLDSWFGASSLKEAEDLLTNGYQAAVNPKVLKAGANGNKKRVQFINDIQGFAPVVPLALMGVPQNMINMSTRKIKTKVLDIYVEMSAGACYEPEQFIKAGNLVLEAIVGLEKQGYRLNLYSVQTYTEERDADILVVKVKDSGRLLDLKRASFPLAHPAFFRTIGFDWYSKVPGGKYRSGYGRSISHQVRGSELREAVRQLWGDTAIMLSYSSIIDHGEEYIDEEISNVRK